MIAIAVRGFGCCFSYSGPYPNELMRHVTDFEGGDFCTLEVRVRVKVRVKVMVIVIVRVRVRVRIRVRLRLRVSCLRLYLGSTISSTKP